jgi:hypothetical protein
MPLITIITGTIGNILNCLIFTRRSLVRNSCSIYFLASSIANFLAIYFGCLTRLLGTFNINPPASQMALYCKTKTFLTYIGLAGSAWFIVGACADRYASSSLAVRIRSFSQVKVARRVVIIISIIVILVYFQMNFCFDGTIQAANCYPSTPFCNTWNDYNLLVTFSLFPPILMLILGWMTIQNVRNGRHLRRETSAKDRQLTAMLLIQVTCITILSMPISIQKIYAAITLNQTKDAYQTAVANFFATFVVLLALMNASTSFYLFTLTGKVFRQQLKLLFFSNQRQATIQPTATVMIKMTNRKSHPNAGQ